MNLQVRAVNGFATGSAASSMATPVETTDPPGIPVGVEVMPGNGVLSLQWSAACQWSGVRGSGRARNANGSGDASSSVRQTPGVPLASGTN